MSRMSAIRKLATRGAVPGAITGGLAGGAIGATEERGFSSSLFGGLKGLAVGALGGAVGGTIMNANAARKMYSTGGKMIGATAGSQARFGNIKPSMMRSGFGGLIAGGGVGAYASLPSNNTNTYSDASLSNRLKYDKMRAKMKADQQIRVLKELQGNR